MVMTMTTIIVMMMTMMTYCELFKLFSKWNSVSLKIINLKRERQFTTSVCELNIYLQLPNRGFTPIAGLLTPKFKVGVLTIKLHVSDTTLIRELKRYYTPICLTWGWIPILKILLLLLTTYTLNLKIIVEIYTKKLTDGEKLSTKQGLPFGIHGACPRREKICIWNKNNFN